MTRLFPARKTVCRHGDLDRASLVSDEATRSDRLKISTRSIVSAVKSHVWCDLGAEGAVLHLGTGLYYGLDSVGARIWTLLQQPCSVGELTACYAAGAIEAIISILALRHQLLPPNINFRHGDAGLDLNIVANSSRAGEVLTVLSNSFGFGGTNASIILRSVAA